MIRVTVNGKAHRLEQSLEISALLARLEMARAKSETATQLEDGNYKRAGVYVLVSVVGCLLAMYLGFAGARGVSSLLRGR